MSWLKFWSSPDPEAPRDSETTSTITDKLNTLKTRAEDAATAIRNEATSTVHDLKLSDPSLPASSSSSSSSSNGMLTSLTRPSTIISTVILTTTLLLIARLQRRFAQRFPTATSVPPSYILPSTRRFSRSLFGRVTSVGDADNFRIFHTPLGYLGLWGIVRQVPTDPKLLRNNTVHIRLAGIDAPELSHFGRPAQPYSKEAMDWLTAYVKGRRVRAHVHRADQYSRVVATVYVRRGLVRRDVGLQMLKAGWASMYESKIGADFGGERLEERYKRAEERAKRRGRGMWKGEKLESPREYKNRYRDGGAGKEKEKEKES